MHKKKMRKNMIIGETKRRQRNNNCRQDERNFPTVTKQNMVFKLLSEKRPVEYCNFFQNVENTENRAVFSTSF